MLLGQVNGELVNNVARVARKRAKETTVTVHDDEAVLGIALE